MAELLTAAQMRAIETAAIDRGEVTGLELMERAGRGVVEAIFEEWPELSGGKAGGPAPQTPRGISEQKKRRAVVLCGPGNNGGDGFVVARLLKERGWDVELFLYGNPQKLPPDARVNYERWGEMGEVRPLLTERFNLRISDDDNPDLWVDALFGTGLSRPIRPDLSKVFDDIETGFSELVQSAPGKVVAVDIPSGLDSDSGKVLQKLLAAEQERATVIGTKGPIQTFAERPVYPLLSNLTVTFHCAKIGHVTGNGPEICRKVATKGIGLNDQRWHQPDFWSVEKVVTRLGPNGLASNLAKDTGHKYTHGHALILSGGAGHTGAARLAARGALRIGAGLVTLGVPGSAQMEVASQITALMLKRVDDGAALAELLEDDRLNALCLGPGLGLSEERAALTETALKSARATVLDADALTLIAQNPALFDLLHDKCVLTPHAGEFKRLFPDIAKRLSEEPMSGPAYSKVDATRAAAKRAGCTVLFKGPDTVIADPSGRCAINSAHYDRAAPWLATAGSGDVLAGFITGLLARGFAPMQAAETAAWLHVECALSFGPGLIAEDIPEELPKVFRNLGL